MEAGGKIALSDIKLIGIPVYFFRDNVPLIWVFLVFCIMSHIGCNGRSDIKWKQEGRLPCPTLN
jgi:hypothetical protein